MSKITNMIREHHRELGATLTRSVEAIVEGRADADPAAFAEFLRGDLLPHAVGEERHLYPAVDPLVKQHGTATATMSVDHEVITDLINQVSEAAAQLQGASGDARGEIEERLRRAALKLEAILALHLRKEEEVYLPLFERYLSEAEQERVLDGMHSAYDEPDAGDGQVLDVRELAPPQRHALIFQTFNALKSGGAFVLVNDHDPKPLYYQFAHEHEGEFTWDYLEQGPAAWRVRIGKTGG